MSDVGFKKKCKVIDLNNPTQYTVVQISGIRCLHNELRVGLTFKLSLWTVDSVWDENEVFFSWCNPYYSRLSNHHPD